MKLVNTLIFVILLGAAKAQTNFIDDETINCTAVKDQYMSSTCWSFAGLSFLEAEVLRVQNRTIDLSEMFVARHAYLLKIKKHLELDGKNYFTPGGQFHDIQQVVNTYGLMPEVAYSGKKADTKHNHTLLDTAVAKYVKKLLQKKQKGLTRVDEKYFENLFDIHLGKLPDSFVHEGKTYTAKSFATDVVSLNMDQYITITAYNHHPLHKDILLEDKYNWSGKNYYNVSLLEFMKYINLALKNDFSLVWVGDVTNKNFDFYNGTAINNDLLFAALDSVRNINFKTHTSEIDHVMHIVGMAYDDQQTDNTYYKIKNSWGMSNPFKGYMYMNYNYLAIETMAIVVHNEVLMIE